MGEYIERVVMVSLLGFVGLVMILLMPTMVNEIVSGMVGETQEVYKEGEENILTEEGKETVKEEQKEESKEKTEEVNQNKEWEQLFTFMAGMLKVLAVVAMVLSIVVMVGMFWDDIGKKITKIYGEYSDRLNTKKYLGYSEYLTNKKMLEILGTSWEPNYGQLGEKLYEINKVYLRDKENNGVKMYKYGEVFTIIYKTYKEAKNEGLQDAEEIVNKVYEAVKYPYEDIVGTGVPGKLLEDMENELRIQKELAKENR